MLDVSLKAPFSYELVAYKENTLEICLACLRCLLGCPDYFACTVLGWLISRDWAIYRRFGGLPNVQKNTDSKFETL